MEAFFDRGILALPLDSIERTHPLDRLLGDLGSGLLRFDQFSLHVRPTSSACNRIADHDAVITGIGICQQNLLVVFEESLWSIAASIHREVEDVVGLSLIANVDPQARIGNFTLALAGH